MVYAPTAAGGLTAGPSARTYRTLGLACLATLLLQYLIPVRPPAFLLKESPTRPYPHSHHGRLSGGHGRGAGQEGGGSSVTPAQQQLVWEAQGPGGRGTEWRVGEFKGKPWRTAQTVSVARVVSTPFGICELHQVRDPAAPDDKVLSDWLWFDEKDQVNVLAQLEASQGGGFLVFRTRKYGLEGESLSPIGGLVEPGEEAQAAAERELLEEAGLVSSSWVPLGRYRISSTRGGGFLNVFLAQACRQAPPEASLKSDDREAQERFVLSEAQLQEALLTGAFKEAKWTQTVAMALVWIRQQQQPVAAREGVPALPQLADQ